MKAKTKKKNKFLWVIAALLLLFMFFESAFSIKVKAEETETQSPTYTNVIDDLEKDEKFSVDDYPAKADDYSLQVIQIAESVNNELFVYVYQPSKAVKPLTATTIRFSTPAVNVTALPNDYELTLLSSYGVFDKYKVEDFFIKTDSVRYYDIIAIHRAFDSTIDSGTDFNYDQTVNEVVYRVGCLYKVETLNGEITYTKTVSETIEIMTKLVGFVRYEKGFSLFDDACDSHFVAFNTDRNIDNLTNARVSYKWQTCEYSPTCDGPLQLLGTINKETVDVSSNERYFFDGGFLGKDYTWNRIEKTADFIAGNTEDLNLTTGNLVDLQNTAWVLRFAETGFDAAALMDGDIPCRSCTYVSAVTILSLTFQIGTEAYTYGVVDNKQTGSDDAFANADTTFDDFVEWLGEWWQNLDVLSLLLAVLGVLLLFTIGGNIISAVLGFAFKILWWIICLPFTLLSLLFGLFKKRK